MPKSRKVLDISIPVPWGVIAGKTFGEKKDTPVLCVHGRNDNLETFSQLLPLLSDSHYYVCIDLPGHGKSTHADKGYILDLIWYTMTVKRIVDYFNWSKLYYMGHSLGGQIGFLLSALYPELVMKLVVIDSFIYTHVPTAEFARAVRDNLFESTLKLEKRSGLDEAPTYSFNEFLQKMIQTRMTEVSQNQIRTMAERNLIRIGPDQFKFGNDQRNKVVKIHFTSEQLESVAKVIRCPTLEILGKNSAVTQPLKNKSPLRKNINVRVHVIDGDHDIHIARAELVARLIVPFLSDKVMSKL
ncbi:serine hydrolase-like protein isoform X2 [Homalodisca vitripennis]|uniref:serine hydrolase-like protein isoform X2 n=1 Tax=Homalodisca vitripennis TaxID=197043 RepID=UPI001EEB1DD2|nr:serine hydrolase-like protein isoform X2 [Homalodisca vitripennis]